MIYTLSMGDAGVEVLERSIGFWNKRFADMVSILTTSPEELYPGIWSAMTEINGYIAGISVAIAVIFFYIGFMRNSIRFEELRRPERFFGYFIRLAIALFLVSSSQSLCLSVLRIFQGTIVQILNLGSVGISADDGLVEGFPEELKNLIESSGMFEGMGVMLLCILAGVFVFALSLVLLLTVYLRFFKIYIYAAISPFPLSSYAGETTSRIGRTFIMNYLAVCLQGIVITIAFIIFANLIQSDFIVDTSESAISNVFDYVGTVILGELLLVATVRASDRLTKEMIGG